MSEMSKGEALKLGNRINKVLRPFKQATEILAAAVNAEGEVVSLAQEYDKLTGIVKRLTKTVSGLESDRAAREEELHVLAASITGEQEALVAVRKISVDEMRLLAAKEAEARKEFAEVMGGFQNAADEAEARLADLHTEEERVNIKIKQFEALTSSSPA